jgi:hypothetical protein
MSLSKSLSQDEVSVDTLLADIRHIAQEQTALTLSIAEGLLASSKDIVGTVRFNSLDEANAFLQARRDDMMGYANQLHELIASCYLDDLIGQKVMKIQQSLADVDKVSSIIVDDLQGKKIELDTVMSMQMAGALLVAPFRQAQPMM